jgi:acyl-CoA dehydrogenase
MAKLVASEAAWFATWAAAQTLGGAGYIRTSPVQKWLRDAKLDEIWDGTSDIMRLIIARSLFG